MIDRDVVKANEELNKMAIRKRAPRPITLAAEESQFLRLSQVLKLIPVSRNTIYSMMAEDRFPKLIKIGRGSFWHKAEVSEWINKVIENRGEQA